MLEAKFTTKQGKFTPSFVEFTPTVFGAASKKKTPNAANSIPSGSFFVAVDIEAALGSRLFQLASELLLSAGQLASALLLSAGLRQWLAERLPNVRPEHTRFSRSAFDNFRLL